jgi:hypothetical protein
MRTAAGPTPNNSVKATRYGMCVFHAIPDTIPP